MFPLMRTFINNQHSTSIIQPHNQTSSLRCALHQHLTLNTYHPTKMFPQMRTSSTPNTQQLSANKHVPSDAHIINTQHSTPINQKTSTHTKKSQQILRHTKQHTKNALTIYLRSVMNFINTKYLKPIPKQTCSLRCSLHQHPTLDTHHPIFITQHPSKAPHTLQDNTLHQSANTTG